jgi:hypothetical protein
MEHIKNVHITLHWHIGRCACLWKLTPWWWLRWVVETCRSKRIIVQWLVIIKYLYVRQLHRMCATLSIFWASSKNSHFLNLSVSRSNVISLSYTHLASKRYLPLRFLAKIFVFCFYSCDMSYSFNHLTLNLTEQRNKNVGKNKQISVAINT